MLVQGDVANGAVNGMLFHRSIKGGNDMKRRINKILIVLGLFYIGLWLVTYFSAEKSLKMQILREARGDAKDAESSGRRALFRDVVERQRLEVGEVSMKLHSCPCPLFFEADWRISEGRGVLGSYLWTPWKIYTLSETVWIS